MNDLSIDVAIAPNLTGATKLGSRRVAVEAGGRAEGGSRQVLAVTVGTPRLDGHVDVCAGAWARDKGVATTSTSTVTSAFPERAGSSPREPECDLRWPVR